MCCTSQKKSAPFCFFVSRIMLIPILDAISALCNIQRQNGVSMKFSCRLVFPDLAQRKIEFPTNFSCRLVFPNRLTPDLFSSPISFLFFVDKYTDNFHNWRLQFLSLSLLKDILITSIYLAAHQLNP